MIATFARSSHVCRCKYTSDTVIPPQILIEEYPLTIEAAETVLNGRRDTEAVIKHHDDRLIVIVGPCSVHDVRAGLEYARRLRAYAQTAKADLHIIMRVYFEKPRYAAAATTC